MVVYSFASFSPLFAKFVSAWAVESGCWGCSQLLLVNMDRTRQPSLVGQSWSLAFMKILLRRRIMAKQHKTSNKKSFWYKVQQCRWKVAKHSTDSTFIFTQNVNKTKEYHSWGKLAYFWIETSAKIPKLFAARSHCYSAVPLSLFAVVSIGGTFI